MDKIFVYNIEDYLPLYCWEGKETVLERNGFENQIYAFDTNLFEDVNQAIKDELNMDSNEEENEDAPDWVKENVKLGAFGEKLVMNYLKSQQLKPEQISKSDSSIGYDILVKTGDLEIAYEVKTTSQNIDKFHISYNELKVANQMKEQYIIFYINVDKNYKNISGYIIKNPIELLDINLKNISNIFDNNNIEIFPSSFIIHLKQRIIGELEIINLLKYK